MQTDFIDAGPYLSVRFNNPPVSEHMEFKVHEGTFEIRLAEGPEPYSVSFAEISYRGERTVIRALREGELAYGGREFRLITFLGDLPFDTVGFLAHVSAAMAERGIPIFVISSYRTDHLLLLRDDLQRGIEALESLGHIQRG